MKIKLTSTVIALAMLALFTLQSTSIALGAGADNKITSSAKDSFIGGGKGNKILTNSIDSVVVGGDTNIIENDAPYAFIGGGSNNTVSGDNAIVGGGANNIASGDDAIVAGGYANTASNVEAAVSGGTLNLASGEWATVSGSYENTASGETATVAGGSYNIARAPLATVSGGKNNTASGEYAIVAGGYGNTALGDYSFAAGYDAQAQYYDSFVWSDGSATTSDSDHEQFVARASGGFYFYTDSSTGGADLPSGSGSWSSMSDRNAKKDFATVNPETVLASVAALPMSTWSYKAEHGVRHIGPMAQDFYTAFSVGEDDRHIADVDEGGVALAAIQGLDRKLDAKDAEIADLKKQNDALAQRLDELEQTVNKLAGRN